MPDIAAMETQDVVIVGAGMAGMSLAIALKQALGPGVAITVCDPALAKVPTSNRTSAIAAGPRRMLQGFGVWDQLHPLAQPIHNMVITDSKADDKVRPVFLQFEAPHGDEPYAHMVFNSDVEHVLRACASGLGIHLLAQQVEGFSETPALVHVTTKDQVIATRLLVAADGMRSSIRKWAGIACVGWDYPLQGIVATVGHGRPHHGVAYEHFLPEGPFAILPITGQRSSIVWTTSQEAARELLALPGPAFQTALLHRFGHQFGQLELLDVPRAWPLSLQIARQMVRGRVALVGDAAHVVHPLAGQGINLGFRDIANLAELIVERVRLGLDVGSPDILAHYERLRRFDSVSTAAAFDGMSRLYAAQNTMTKSLRGLGMRLVDALPELKASLIKEASGVSGAAPRLFSGVGL